MGRKFSSVLLCGKAATLPFMFQTAYAQGISPSYTDLVTGVLTQIQLPATDVRLHTVYDNASLTDAATICTNKWSTQRTAYLSVAVTGLRADDTVFVATSTSVGGNEGFHSGIRIGTQRLLLPVVTKIAGPSNATMSMTIPIALSTLTDAGYPISAGGSFYMQTVVLPAGSISAAGAFDWNMARVSELDSVAIGTCSTYGYDTY